jgi:hypothetical protein
MLLLSVLVAGTATVPLLGGRLSCLLTLHFRHTWAIVAALVLQVVIISVVPSGLPTLHQAAHLGSYGLAAWFLVANRKVSYLWLVASGGAANLLVITANDGVMPARAGALKAAGLLATNDGFANSRRLAHPRLLFLGDAFAVPHPFPLANVFSVGDIAIVVGALLGIHAIAGSRLGRRPSESGRSLTDPDPAPGWRQNPR